MGYFTSYGQGALGAICPMLRGLYDRVQLLNWWVKTGICDRIMDAAIAANEGDVVMIDGSSVRVRHSGTTLKITLKSMFGALKRRVRRMNSRPS